MDWLFLEYRDLSIGFIGIWCRIRPGLSICLRIGPFLWLLRVGCFGIGWIFLLRIKEMLAMYAFY
jgi:hypothetical protein